MVIKSLVKKPATIIGIDCSTKSLAFAKFHKGEFVSCGEIFFEGKNMWQRLRSIHNAIEPMVEDGILACDAVVFERAVSVGNNIDTAISLAYVYGAVIGALNQSNIKVAKVMPLTWQAFIGNPNLKADEKARIQKDFPGKTPSWYKAKGREVRKQKTLDFARQYAKIHTDSDNVGDAIGIGYYAVKNAHLLEYE